MSDKTAEKRLQILIVEDDIDYVDIIRLCLDEPDSMGMKFDLEWADRLAVGLKLLDAAPFDALLLDLTLPDSRGVDTMKAVLGRGYEVPILVMTNLGDESMAFEAMRLGAQDYMVKATSDSRYLKRAISYAIERRKLLAQSESIIKAAPDAMAVIGPDDVVQYVNPAAEALLGGRGLIGQKFAYPSVPAETSLIKLAGVQGAPRTAEMRVTEIQWKGQRARLASIRDITELQRLEQLKAEIGERRRLDQLKDDLIGTVSHELRTPLTIIKGAVDNLKEGICGTLSPKQDQIVVLAHRNVGRLSKMINNLLDLSRLESDVARARRRRANPRTLLNDVAEGFALTVQDRGVVLERELAEGLPDVYADPDMITQILSNLIDNALRYAKSRVCLRAAPTQEGGVLFEVIDDGPGIPPDRIGEMFDKFVQVNRSVGGSGYKGTGLGLAICKEIMMLHGGKVGVESMPGVATRFYFELPKFVESAKEQTA